MLQHNERLVLLRFVILTPFFATSAEINSSSLVIWPKRISDGVSTS